MVVPVAVGVDATASSGMNVPLGAGISALLSTTVLIPLTARLASTLESASPSAGHAIALDPPGDDPVPPALPPVGDGPVDVPRTALAADAPSR